MNALEAFLYEISKFFLMPVLVVLCAMFLFALFAAGMLLFDMALRATPRARRASRWCSTAGGTRRPMPRPWSCTC
jgi:hypothetical protein